MRRLILTIFILFCLKGILLAQDMGGRALLTYQETHSEETTTSGLTQNYELRFQKRVTLPLQYRLFLRWEDNMGRLKGKESEEKTRVQLLQPSVDLLYQFAPFEFRVGLELTRTDNKPNPGEHTLLQEERFFSNFSWRPEGFPNFVFQIDRKASEDKTSLIDTVDTGLSTTTDYTYKAFKFLHTFRFRQFTDEILNFTREDYANLGRLDFQDNFFRNRLNITTNYLIDYGKRFQISEVGSPISIPVERIPQKGLYSNDDTPLDNSDNPLVETPSLIDRNLNASTGINIGTPGGLYFHNIAVDLGRSFSVDQIMIYVRNSAGAVVPSGGPITWDVYTSSDGINWTLQAAAASTVFNSTFSHYQITFTAPPARFFKVVNFGVNTVETLVTEIQIFGQEAFETGEKKTTTTLMQTGNLTTLFKPIAKLTLSYDGFFKTFKEEAEKSPTFTSTEWTQGFTALLEPLRFFSTTVRYQKRRSTQTEGQDEDADFYSAVFNFFFLQNLDTSFSASRKNERIDGAKTTLSDSFLLRGAARLYKNWDVSLDLQYSDEKNFKENLSTDSYSITGTSFAQLTKNLSWSVNGTAEWTSVTNLTDQKTQEERITTEFFYRPSQQVNLSALWGYVRGEDQSGLTQRYKFDWLPFPDGAIHFNATYNLDRDPTSKQSSDRILSLIRWNINRYAYLEFNYVRTVQEAIETLRTKSFFSTFNLTF